MQEAAGGSVNPGIFVDRHSGRLQDINLGMENIRRFMLGNTRGWNQIGEMEVQKAGEFDAGLMRYSYEVIGAGNVKITVEEMLWVVPQDNHYFTISTGFSPDDRSEIEPLILETVSTLKKLD